MTADVTAILERYDIATPPSLAERYGVRRAADLDTSPPRPLYLDLLEEGALTVIFGPGDTGKGILSAWVAAEARRTRRVLVLDFEGHEAEYGRRWHGLGATEPLYIAPLATPGLAGPITARAEVIRDLCDELEVEVLVIDSIAFAVPGLDVKDETTATAFSAAVKLIGRTTLAVGHTTKTGDPWPKYPFGSAFWHNGCRVSWAIEKVDDDPHTVELRNRKGNAHGPLPDRRYVITYADGLPVEVAAETMSRAKVDRIDAVLAGGPLTLDEVLDALAEDGGRTEDRTKVGSLLRKYALSGRYERLPGSPLRYALAERTE